MKIFEKLSNFKEKPQKLVDFKWKSAIFSENLEFKGNLQKLLDFKGKLAMFNKNLLNFKEKSKNSKC